MNDGDVFVVTRRIMSHKLSGDYIMVPEGTMLEYVGHWDHPNEALEHRGTYHRFRFGDEHIVIYYGDTNRLSAMEAVHPLILLAMQAPMTEPGWYEDHPDVGKQIVLTESIIYGDPTTPVPAGTRGVLLEVQPSASLLVYLCDLNGVGRRAVWRSQFRFISTLELLAECAP